MSVHNIRPLSQKKAKKFPDSDDILNGNLTAHLRNDNGCDALLQRKVGHVVLARWHCARNQERFNPGFLRRRSQPCDMTRRPTHVEAGNYANDLHESSIL